MKAAVLSALGTPLILEDMADPVLTGTGEVIVQVVATKVLSYAREVVNGQRPFLFPLPFIPGSGAVGRVLAVGADAAELAVGDWVLCDPTVRSRDNPQAPAIVLQGLTAAGPQALALQRAFADGTWAEQVRVPTENAIRLGAADALEPADAPRWTTLGSALVPFGGLTAAQLAAGETVVINGATGTFGAAGVAVALAMGAGCVLATGRNRAVLARLHERFGARVRPVPMSGDEAVDRQRILDAAPGPIDCVLDLLPPAATAAQVRAALTTVRPGGRVVLMGGLPHDVPVSYAWLMRNNVTLRGQWMYARESIPRALQLVRAGLLSLDTVQLKTFALREVNEAIAHAAAHGGPFDGVVICP
jgi:alcohol dehydrogenase